MAAPTKPAAQAAKGGAQKKGGNKTKSRMYEINEGKVTRKGQSCPRCGDGVFLAAHKDRVSCGKCGYTEYKK
ncbi:MAG TPA: 30S ribosomal protein S27ae [Methanocella sp.]|nr:30S ribosomal protein S27ae [Methanocella sp.]